jgi:hypothetical protein
MAQFSRWRWQEPADLASDQMLQLQLDNLELRFQMINQDTLSPDEKSRYNEIASVFSDGHAGDPTKTLTWDDAYRLETGIGSLLHDDRLLEEITSNLQSAVADQVPEATDLQTRFTALTKDGKASNAVLLDFFLEVMEAIHWCSKRKYIMRKVRAQAARRTLCLALIALLIALAPYLFLSSAGQPNVKPASLASLQSPNLQLVVSLAAEDSWVHFALYTSVTFGFLGALFSRLISLQKQWSAMALDELYNARTYHYIVLRASVGVVGAMVVYFFLQSGLVSGSVFPKFTQLTMNAISFSDAGADKWPAKLILPSADLALLIMWSFIAGFSESLVPNVLSNAERQFTGALSAQ